jgi:hypothetical protein
MQGAPTDDHRKRNSVTTEERDSHLRDRLNGFDARISRLESLGYVALGTSLINAVLFFTAHMPAIHP